MKITTVTKPCQNRHNRYRIFPALPVLMAPLFLSGCFQSTQSKAQADTAINAGSNAVIAYSGLSSAQNLTLNPTAIQVTWPAPPSSYKRIQIYSYSMNTGAMTQLATVPATLTSYTQTGLTTGNLYSYIGQAVDANGNADGNLNIVSALVYPGITSITSVGQSTAYVNFLAPGVNSSGAHIYCAIRSGAYSLLATVTNPSATSYQLTGLQSGTTYTCKVNAILTVNGLDDNNGATQTFQTISQSASAYQGPVLVQAFGDAPNAPTAATAAAANPPISNPVTTPTAKQVSITWKNFNVSNPRTAQYRLVRVQKGGALDMNTAVVCTPSTTTSCQVCLSTTYTNMNSRTCQDTLISGSPAQYEYAVTLIVNPTTTPPMAEEMPASGDAPYRILVPIPPANMVLVQRDAANYEMCQLMGLASDPLNHQRCSYTGQGNVPYNMNPGGTPLGLSTSYYDFGYNLFIDRWNAACNWTPQVSGGMCGSGATAGDCNGVGAPAGTVGVNGNVYYDYNGGYCYVKQSGSWIGSWASSSMTTASLQAMYTNAPSLTARKPPLVQAQQTDAWNYCQSTIDLNYGAKRLMRRREQVAASAFQWMSAEPNALSLSAIGTLEAGTSYPTTQACNAYSASGVTATASFNTSNEMAGNSAGGIQSFVIGSDFTAQCASRFGAQDLVGNVWEWVSDQLSNCSTVSHTCTSGAASGLDSGNRDLASVNWDGIMGPGGTSAGQTGPSYTTGWGFSAPAFGANYFSAPLGLPLVSNDGGNALLIGTAITSTQLHTEYFWLYTENGVQRGALVGGSWINGSNDGRFTLYLANAPSGTAYNIGFRCALPAQ